MGWTSIHAETDYRGRIDRIEEVNKLFTCSNEHGTWKPLKTLQVGSTVYSAVERVKETGERYVFAAIVLTSTNSKDYFNFMYKDMDESCGPYEDKCPNSILKMLTTTDNEYALAWRERCYKNIEIKKQKKANPNSLNNLPIGSRIQLVYNGEKVVLTKTPYYRPKTIWFDGIHTRYKNSLIESLGYTVLS